MIDGKSIYAVIPARGGSKRLPRKNIAPLWGQPLIAWAIRACEASEFIDRCYVSTEDDEVAEVAQSFGARLIERPAALAGDQVFKQEAIVHATEQFDPQPDIVISLQPNSPQVCAVDLDGAIAKLNESGASEIFSVGEDLMQNGAFRVMKYEYVFQKSLSTHCGVYVADHLDLHTAEDLAWLETNAQPCQDEKVVRS